MLSGDAATEAADRLVERLTRIAAHLLEAAPTTWCSRAGDSGCWSSRVGDVADRAARSVPRTLLPPDERAELEGGALRTPGTFSSAAHPPWSRSTLHLEVSIVRYLVTEDCGVMINL